MIKNIIEKTLSFAEKKLSSYMLVFLAVFVVSIIVYKADWLMGDNYLFIKTTASGKPAPLYNPVNIGDSRFFPLAGLDFNILLLLPFKMGCSAMAHYVYVAITFLAMYALFIFSLTETLRQKTKYLMSFIFLAALLLSVNKSSFMTFLNVNFSERMIGFIFALFIFCIVRSGMAENRDVSFGRWHIAAVICAAASTYMKETVFAFYFAFSAVSLLFFYKKMNFAQKKLHFILLGNGILFLILYFCFAFNQNSDHTYRSDYSLGLAGVFKSIFINMKALFAIMLAAAIRIVLVSMRKIRPQPVFDPLLIASVIYICEYAVLGFGDYYYYFPAIVSGLVPLFYFLFEFRHENICSGKNAMCRKAFIFMAMLLALIPVIEFPKAMNLAKITVFSRSSTMPCLRSIAEHYLAGGHIYWYQPVNNERHLFELTGLYLNYILEGKKKIAMFRTDYVPSDMEENDVFIYSPSDGNGNYYSDEFVLRELKLQDFRFSRQAGDFFVFFKNGTQGSN